MNDEPIRRKEYERRHLALQKKYESLARTTKRVLAIIVFSLLLTASSSTYLLHENGQRTQDIANSLVQSCINSGNPLRAATRQFGRTLISQIVDDIKQSKAFERSGTYEEIFPTYPPEKLHHLLVINRQHEHETIDKLNAAIDRVEAVDCHAKYPK